MNIQNKTAIVTGASRGIGLAIAKALVNEGVTVAGWSRTPPDTFTHDRFHHIKADLTVEKSVHEAFQETVNKMGDSIPILINNAGMGYRGPMAEMQSDKWHELFDLNVHGIFYTTKRIIPQMKKENEGHIINIGSGAGTNGIAGMSGFCVTKSPLIFRSTNWMRVVEGKRVG